MKLRVLLAAIAAVMLIGGISAARADILVAGVLHGGRYAPRVDTVKFLYGARDTVPILTPGWAATQAVDDTFDFPAIQGWPSGMRVCMNLNNLWYPYNITSPVRDSWYYWNLGAPQPGVKFYVLDAVEENGGAGFRQVSTLRATPSPFRSSTSLSFSANSTGWARLEVCDASGRLVRGLASGTFTVGRHAFTWDARDEDGRRVGAGTYFAQLTTASGRTHTKLVLSY